MARSARAPHFPGAMFDAKGNPCWCGAPTCRRCWYTNWYFCRDVMEARTGGRREGLRPEEILRQHPEDTSYSPEDGQDDAFNKRRWEKYWQRMKVQNKEAA